MQQENRCIARTLKNKDIWGSTITNSGFGVRCTRKIKVICFCGLHEKKQPYGIFNNVCIPSEIFMDIDDNVYQVLKQQNLSPLRYFEENTDIYEYVNNHLRTIQSGLLISNKKMLFEKFIIENIKKNHKYMSSPLCLENVSKTDFRNVYTSIIEDVLLEPSVMNHLVKTSVKELQIRQIKLILDKKETLKEKTVKKGKISKKFNDLQVWWKKSHKIKITDYETKKSGTFAVEEECENKSILYTPTKVLVGYCQYWKSSYVPNNFKNEYGIIISPQGQYYLSHITLLPDRKMFHNLSKTEYFEYKYISEYNILRNTYEIEFL